MAKPIRSWRLEGLFCAGREGEAWLGEYGDCDRIKAIGWTELICCGFLPSELTGLGGDSGPEPDVGSRGIGFEK
jgi:hypothetical protein